MSASTTRAPGLGQGWHVRTLGAAAALLVLALPTHAQGRAPGAATAAPAAADFEEAVVAAAHGTLTLSQEAYRAGTVNFLPLQQVRRDTLEAQRGYLAALEALVGAQADLARAMGETTPSPPGSRGGASPGHGSGRP